MKNINCEICNKQTTIKNNKCKYCQCSIFINNVDDSIDDNKYDKIINDVSNKSGIDKYIIKKMIKFGLLRTFRIKKESTDPTKVMIISLPAIRFLNTENTIVTFVSKEINIQKNESAAYLFFKYKEMNKNTYFKNEDKPYIYFKDNENILSIKIIFMSSEKLDLLIKYKLEDYCKYPICWLKEEEKINLKKHIDNEFDLFSIDDQEYIRYHLNITNNEDLDIILNDISIKMQEKMDYNQDKKSAIKKTTIRYFERVLLEKQMQDF